MDVDFKTPPKDENSTAEDSVQKSVAVGDTNGSTKDSGKHPIKLKRGRTRSRSSTPQKKVEEQKTLHVSLMKIGNELNGKDLTEETEKTDEKIESKDHDKEKADISKDKTDKVEELENKEQQSKKQNGNTQKEEDKPKDEKLKKDESPKKDAVTKKITTPKKGSPKRDSPKKVSSPKKGSSPKQKNESPKREKRGKKQESSQPRNETETDTVEMDPLVISDEADPELEFDENSDLESGKGSPILARCTTRRSQTRNIPTPKTPKSIEQDVDSEKNSSTHTPTEMSENDDVPKTDNLNNSTNISTKAAVGSDATRMAYIDTHDSNFTDDSYLNASRERSLSETLRSLSARRPIRSTEDYRKRVLRTNQDRSDLNMPYTSRSSVEQISSSVKRKSRSATPEERKKFKGESPVVNSLFSSPLSNFRNRFRSDLPSSTPKLLGYKEKSGLHYNDEDHFTAVENGDDEKKSWCSIM